MTSFRNGDTVYLRGCEELGFDVLITNYDGTYEIRCDYGTLDFVPEYLLVGGSRKPRKGDVYKVLGDFVDSNVHLHIIDVDGSHITYFRTDDHFGEVTVVTADKLDLSECELVFEGPRK